MIGLGGLDFGHVDSLGTIVYQMKGSQITGVGVDVEKLQEKQLRNIQNLCVGQKWYMIENYGVV